MWPSINRKYVRRYLSPSWTLSTFVHCWYDEQEKDHTDYSLGFSPQKQNTKKIKPSEYPQHVKGKEILMFTLK